MDWNEVRGLLQRALSKMREGLSMSRPNRQLNAGIEGVLKALESISEF